MVISSLRKFIAFFCRLPATNSAVKAGKKKIAGCEQQDGGHEDGSVFGRCLGGALGKFGNGGGHAPPALQGAPGAATVFQLGGALSRHAHWRPRRQDRHEQRGALRRL